MAELKAALEKLPSDRQEELKRKLEQERSSEKSDRFVESAVLTGRQVLKCPDASVSFCRLRDFPRRMAMLMTGANCWIFNFSAKGIGANTAIFSVITNYHYAGFDAAHAVGGPGNRRAAKENRVNSAAEKT